MKKRNLKLIILLGMIFTLPIFTSFGLNDNHKNNQKSLTISTNNVTELLWENNGTEICTAVNDQKNLQICSDEEGGAIIVWQDGRGADWRIFAQKINSTGHIQWTINGTRVSSLTLSQENPKICSDGEGGVIITFDYYASGLFGVRHWDVYAQRISSSGNKMWGANGIALASSDADEFYVQICSDGAGGALITWTTSTLNCFAQKVNSSGAKQWGVDGVNIGLGGAYEALSYICSDGAGGAIISFLYLDVPASDVFAQRISSDGSRLWTPNGIPITNNGDASEFIEICSDGVGGAIIAWQYMTGANLYAQRINLNGNVQWGVNGIPICNASGTQDQLKVCSDGAQGAIFTWKDQRGINSDIYIQHINSTGDAQYAANGVPLCSENDNQENPQISSDGKGGAIITWDDSRNGLDKDIYAQRINSNGKDHWEANGTIICNANQTQNQPQVCSDGGEGAIITWRDARNGVDFNIFVQYIIEDLPPTSNHPEDIETYKDGSENIDWVLYDDFGSGQYRVMANYTNGNYYVWVDWTPWSNNTSLNVPINRTTPGIYNYIIEFYDDQDQFGISDTVIIRIIDKIPISNHPADIIIYEGLSETIDWILYDDYGGGYYRVLINGTPGGWSIWSNNTPINYLVDTSITGIFNYTIQYYDSNGQFGVPDTVIIEIIESPTDGGVPAIHGYNLLLLMVSVIPIVLILKRKIKWNSNT